MPLIRSSVQRTVPLPWCLTSEYSSLSIPSMWGLDLFCSALFCSILFCYAILITAVSIHILIMWFLNGDCNFDVKLNVHLCLASSLGVCDTSRHEARVRSASIQRSVILAERTFFDNWRRSGWMQEWLQHMGVYRRHKQQAAAQLCVPVWRCAEWVLKQSEGTLPLHLTVHCTSNHWDVITQHNSFIEIVQNN